MKASEIRDLQSLPGIGPSLVRDLHDLGFSGPGDLHGQDPEEMYRALCELRGRSVDRCVLYCFRCAVHAVSSDGDDAGLRKWWNWKDEAP